VVPLILTESQDVTIDKLSKLNGVLMPGGDGDNLEYGRFIYSKIKDYNDNDTYYPLWGVCMGYENLISYAANGGWDVLTTFDFDHGSLPLKFTKDPRDT
jgi:carbamoylphosphate synthase small subunit